MRRCTILLIAMVSACDPFVLDIDPDAGAGPEVQGERSAGHGDPIWTWTRPEGTIAFRHRLDEGGWVTVDATITRWSPASELAAGDHVFEVQAQDATGAWSASGRFTTRVEYFTRPGHWTGLRRDPHRSPLGHDVVVACQACYQIGLGSSIDNLHETLAKIHTAQDKGTDALELAVRVAQGTWYVAGPNDTATNGALLAEILADPALRDGDQVLVIDFAERLPQDADLRRLIDLLLDGGYAYNGRPLVLRGTEEVQASVEAARGAITPESRPFQYAYVRYHLQVAGGEDPLAMQTKLSQLANVWDAVELDQRMPNLFGALVFARLHGLGVGVTAVDTNVSCTAFREQVDLILSSGDSSVCGQTLAAAPPIVFADVSEQQGTEVHYLAGDVPSTVSLAGDARPSLHTDGSNPPEDRYGGSLFFDDTDHLPFHDGDNRPDGGYLVAVVANFDTLQVAEGGTAALLSKAENSGFSLELFRDPGATTKTLLRFSVFVGGTYHYATYDATLLNGNDSYFVVGAYDGAGKVRLWVNGVEGTPSATLSGGVETNDLNIVVAANPAPNDTFGSYWGGLVQSVMVVDWKR